MMVIIKVNLLALQTKNTHITKLNSYHMLITILKSLKELFLCSFMVNIKRL